MEWADFFSFFFLAQDLQRETTQFSFTGSKKVYQSGSFGPDAAVPEKLNIIIFLHYNEKLTGILNNCIKILG